MSACIDCSCEHHDRALIEGRWFLRCTACLRLSAPIGATIVKPAIFLKAVNLAGPRSPRRDADAVAICVVLVIAFLVAWNSGGAHGF